MGNKSDLYYVSLTEQQIVSDEIYSNLLKGTFRTAIWNKRKSVPPHEIAHAMATIQELVMSVRPHTSKG